MESWQLFFATLYKAGPGSLALHFLPRYQMLQILSLEKLSWLWREALAPLILIFTF